MVWQCVMKSVSLAMKFLGLSKLVDPLPSPIFWKRVGVFLYCTSFIGFRRIKALGLFRDFCLEKQENGEAVVEASVTLRLIWSLL